MGCTSNKMKEEEDLSAQKNVQRIQQQLFTAMSGIVREGSSLQHGDHQGVTEPPKITKQRSQTKKKKKIWKNKRLHGKFIRDTEDIADIKSWYWLWNGHSKRERESLITSAQEQYIRTNKIKTKIDGTRNDPK